MSPSVHSAQPPFRASDFATDRKTHLLIAATGSVATIKLPQIVASLSRHAQNLSIRLILSASSTRFLQGQAAEQPALSSLLALPGVEGIHTDEDEWEPAWKRGAPVLHIELRRWADALLVAPLSANSLAKVALGLADNLFSSVVRAWDTTGLIDARREGVPEGTRTMTTAAAAGTGGDGAQRRKRIWIAPAMNTAMWLHPVTRKHLTVLEEEWGEERAEGGWFRVLRPVEKELACGDVGGGAMMEWTQIVREIEMGLCLTP